MSQTNDKSQQVEQADEYGIREGDIVEIMLSSTLDERRMKCTKTRGTPGDHPDDWTHAFRHWDTGYFLSPDGELIDLPTKGSELYKIDDVESIRVVEVRRPDDNKGDLR